MQKFERNVTGSYSNHAMLRQISEGVRIDQVPEGSLMNSKNKLKGIISAFHAR